MDVTNLNTNITKEEGIYTICKAYLNSYCKESLGDLTRKLGSFRSTGIISLNPQ